MRQGLADRGGTRVTIGEGALLEGCVIEDGAVVGTGAIVLREKKRLSASAERWTRTAADEYRD